MAAGVGTVVGTVANRVQQGLRAMFAFARPVDLDLAGRYLNPAQMALFTQMSRGEQLHSVQVLRSLLADSEPLPDDLGAAALLHDVGKIRYPMNVIQKALPVLVRVVSLSLARRIASGSEADRWRRPFIVFARHPRWSGELVATTGASPRLIWLVTHHSDHLTLFPDRPAADIELLRRLQQADDAN